MYCNTIYKLKDKSDSNGNKEGESFFFLLLSKNYHLYDLFANIVCISKLVTGEI